MKIIEVRDGFIKFEADSSIYLSTFIQAEGTGKNYIAQVNKLNSVGNVCIASAKILFVMINDELYNYDRTEPSKDAEITNFGFNFLQNTIKITEPIIVGKTLDNSENIVVDASAFNKKMLISVDDSDMNNLLVRNLSKQFVNLNKKTVIIDTLGVIKAKKYTAGVDFKLPINKSTLDFIYKSCLNDATADSKSIITEIFSDLAEYAETVPFVPFKTLKNIIDDMVDKQHIFKLFVLKNKLAKFEAMGYFATKNEEAQNISKILDLKNSIIDISKLDFCFQNFYLEYIYSQLENQDLQVFLETSNTLSKKSLKTAMVTSSAPTTLIVHSHFNYLNDIKNLFDNFILEASVANKSLFKIYNTFFDSMSKDMYLIAGEGINYIPVACNAQVIDDLANVEDYVVEESIEEPNAEEPIIEEPEIEEQQEELTVQDTSESEQEIDVVEEITEEDNTTIDEAITREELLQNIDEKSEEAINVVSEGIEKTEELDLFSDEEISQDEVEEASGDELNEPSEPIESEDEIEDVIEPEYSEVEETIVSEEVEDIDLVEHMKEPPEENEDLQMETEDTTSEPVESDVEDTAIIPEYDEQESVISDDDSIEELPLEVYSEEDNELVLSDLDDGESTEQKSLVDDQEVVPDIIEEDEELTLQLNENEEALLQDLEEPAEESDNAVDDISNLPEEVQVIPADDNDEFQNLDEFVELDSTEENDDAILVDITEENDNIVIDEEQDRQIIEDVDRVYSTVKDADNLEEISDSDLDLIDELNNDNDVLEELSEDTEESQDTAVEEGILDQPHENSIPQRQGTSNGSEILEKRDSSTPIVPVYDADIPAEDMVVSDPIQQGDSVIHAKYGNGVVEKMIKYGNKTLFSINFDNIGRRLLDPTLTEIKKI